ncbi:MAG TPA: tetratricopeptide repeat protein [Terriglobales bacterium]|nr:tetratricopeptide repeat protein [Terriglobales bacterium]
MSQSKNGRSASTWTNSQAYSLIVICLLVGIAAGWFLRGSQSPVASPGVQAATSVPGMSNVNTGEQPSPQQMKMMAETQAAPLLEQLRSEPSNAELLAKIGNIYYDTQQYPTAIDYYRRALDLQPANVGVRTDFATAIWYTGDADAAISEFNKALSYDPTKANTLFNLGVVKWQGKMDINGAVAAWQKLLETNPNYENKQKVLDLIAEAKKHSNLKPETAANR